MANELFGMPAIIIPKPFNLASIPKQEKDEVREEVMEKVRMWERRMDKFFRDYLVYADSWRVKPMGSYIKKKPDGLHQSKSGETHRAVETLGTYWLRSLTAADPYFESVAEGLDDFGRELTPEDLYAIETVLQKQLVASGFKGKLLRSLYSTGLFGMAIVEEPFVSKPTSSIEKKVEYTDFVFRSLLKTGFDAGVTDIDFSDYVFTVDFPTKWMLKKWSKADGEVWDGSAIEKHLEDAANFISLNISKKETGVYDRLKESKQRAGYTEIDDSVFEFINYHGSLESGNKIKERYWESEGRTDDYRDVDFSVGLLGGDEVIKWHPEQEGTWHSRFKVATFKPFEDECMPYGIGQIGRKMQREQDLLISRINDLVTMAVYSMWKIGKFAGLNDTDFAIRPNGLIELDDVNQMQRLDTDVNAVTMGLNSLGIMKEDFRNMVGAPTNMQAQITKASATEAAISQDSSQRIAGVHAEIIAETFLRGHIEQMYQNNLRYLDVPIWVQWSGNRTPQFYTRQNLPINVGFKVKAVTDKDFRPERILRIKEALQIFTSIRNVSPGGMNVVEPLLEEYFRSLGMNPNILKKPVPVAQQLQDQMQRQGRMQQYPQLANEMEGEVAQEMVEPGVEAGASGVGGGLIPGL